MLIQVGCGFVRVGGERVMRARRIDVLKWIKLNNI